MYGLCKVCKKPVSGGLEYHENCKRSLFQLDEIISIYENGEPPHWIVDALCDLAWIYDNNSKTAGYFNVASEIAESFVIENEASIDRNEIKWLGITSVPEGEILELLSDGRLIKYDDKRVYPSTFLIKAQIIAAKGNELDSEEATQKRKEMYGFLAVCLTKSLLNIGRSGVPRTALSIFQLLSEQMKREEANNDVISDDAVVSAFGNLTPSQQSKQMRKMAGFDPSGTAKIIRDVDYDGIPHLKSCMVTYIDNMRERFRSRERGFRSRSD